MESYHGREVNETRKRGQAVCLSCAVQGFAAAAASLKRVLSENSNAAKTGLFSANGSQGLRPSPAPPATEAGTVGSGASPTVVLAV